MRNNQSRKNKKTTIQRRLKKMRDAVKVQATNNWPPDLQMHWRAYRSRVFGEVELIATQLNASNHSPCSPHVLDDCEASVQSRLFPCVAAKTEARLQNWTIGVKRNRKMQAEKKNHARMLLSSNTKEWCAISGDFSDTTRSGRHGWCERWCCSASSRTRRRRVKLWCYSPITTARWKRRYGLRCWLRSESQSKTLMGNEGRLSCFCLFVCFDVV